MHRAKQSPRPDPAAVAYIEQSLSLYPSDFPEVRYAVEFYLAHVKMMKVNPFKFKQNCLSCTKLTWKGSTKQVNFHLCVVGSMFGDKTSIHAILCKMYGKVCQTIPQGHLLFTCGSTKDVH